MPGGGRTAAAVLFPEDSEHTGISCAISISGRARQESTVVSSYCALLFITAKGLLLVALLGLDARSGARVVPR